MGEPMYEDELLAMLRALPGADMDPRRARQVRDRACATLTRRQRPFARWPEALAAFYDRLLEPILVGALAAGFLAWVAGRCVEAVSQGPGVFF
jgi:hypothetical protein